MLARDGEPGLFEFTPDAVYWYNVALAYHQLMVLSDADAVREAPSRLSRALEQPSNVARGVANPWETRPDTEYTVYRHNHITTQMWQAMTHAERQKWVDDMVKRTGKSVVS